MNYYMVRRLIWKDWYLERWMILASLLAGAFTLGVIVAGGKAGFILGLIALVTVLIGVGVQLAFATTVYERKEQTLPFVMSLPISYREFTAAKILSNLLIFLVPWLALVLGSFGLLVVIPGMPRGIIPYVAIMSTEILVSTCLVAAVAITTESQGWTVGAMLFGNLGLNGFGYYVAHVGSIAKGMWGPRIQWSPAASNILTTEFVVIALLLCLTFFFQSRKRDFL